MNKENTKYQPVGFIHALTDNLDFIGLSFKHEFKPYISKHIKNFEVSFERHQAEVNDLFGISKTDIKFFFNESYTFCDILNEASDWYIDRNRRGPKFQPKAIEKLIAIASYLYGGAVNNNIFHDLVNIVESWPEAAFRISGGIEKWSGQIDRIITGSVMNHDTVKQQLDNLELGYLKNIPLKLGQEEEIKVCVEHFVAAVKSA